MSCSCAVPTMSGVQVTGNLICLALCAAVVLVNTCGRTTHDGFVCSSQNPVIGARAKFDGKVRSLAIVHAQAYGTLVSAKTK